ncbi:MAG TPA: gliding motility-associated C-terminal domain-containing protein, partial [Saprospiraceae bacterium]|nr:gliding motility-associated C-terminal domain-containing protein [Saprospiraceae bacterium]
MKAFAAIFLFLALNTFSGAQNLPKICPTPSYMTPTCAEACLICDINGFTGRNTSTLPGELPPDFCTTVKHNGQWIAFMASSTNLKLNLAVSNCVRSDGLEVGLYESTDCKKFTRISNCDGDVLENTSTTLTITKNLVIGNYYYLVIDGNRGDICDYKVTIVEGSTKVSPLSFSGDITGPLEICQGIQQEYQVSPVNGAAWQQWTLDGVALGTGSTKNINWDIAGTFELCVKAINACDEGDPSCIKVKVNPRKDTMITRSVCEGDSLIINGTHYSNAGNYRILLTSENGCDSAVQLELKVNSTQQQQVNFSICEGDTLRLNGKSYWTAGTFTDRLANIFGCDSLLNLTVKLIQCNIQGDLFAKNALCHQGSTGSLFFLITQGTPPFNYSYNKISDPGINGNGIIQNIGDSVLIQNLSAGDYIISITDNYGNRRVFFGKVSEPDVVQIENILSDYNGFEIACNGQSSGWIEAKGIGGTGPFSFRWNTKDVTSKITNLPAGSYQVTITDQNGCTLTKSYLLNEPPPLLLNAQFQNPSCEDASSGTITINQLIGGTTPYKKYLDGGNFSTENIFSGLQGGRHILIIEDANRCRDSVEIILHTPEHNNIQSKDEYTIDLGDSVQLLVNRQLEPATWKWTPEEFLSCNDCPEPFAKPINDINYSLKTISVDGCADSLLIRIKVLKNRNVFAPNVFSPNDDQINDWFKLFGSNQIRKVEYLKIFDRWGGMVYQNKNFDFYQESQWWNGKVNEQLALPGVYVWISEIVFLDGEH